MRKAFSGWPIQGVLSESRRHFVFPHLKKFLHTFIDFLKPTVVAEMGRYCQYVPLFNLALKILFLKRLELNVVYMVFAKTS